MEIRNLQAICNDEPTENPSNSLSWPDFKTAEARKALMIGVVLVALIQFSGVFAVSIYADSIFKDAGSFASPAVSAITVSVVQIVGSYVPTVLADRAGRKVRTCLSSSFIYYRSEYHVWIGAFRSLSVISVLYAAFGTGHCGCIVYVGLVFATEADGSKCLSLVVVNSIDKLCGYLIHGCDRRHINAIQRYRRNITRKTEELRHVVPGDADVDILPNHIQMFSIYDGSHWHTWNDIHVCWRMHSIIRFHDFLYARNERQKLWGNYEVAAIS